jgi:flagellar basal-body rod protein FlgG
MIRSLYTAISGMTTQQAEENVISNNMANADTNGFKGDNLQIGSFKNVLLANSSDIDNGVNVRHTIGSLSLGSQIDASNTDFTQGDIVSSDSDTDFAIDGRGFFTVSQDNGAASQNYYTRDGHFHVNMQGYLMDENGDYVMGKNVNTGNVEKINIGNGKLTSDEYGNLSVNGKPAYSLDMVDFNDYNSLKKIGSNLYSGTNPIQNANVTVQQKALESSNINVDNEMVNMMNTMRNFESDQKVVSAVDETLQEAVNDVGKV